MINANRREVLIGLICSGATCLSGPVWAADDPATARRINIAGRQRMLTQRIVMASCFIRLGIDTDRHYQILKDANALFSTSLEGLRNGSAEMGLPASSEPKVIEAITGMETIWAELGQVVSEISTRGEVSKSDIGSLAVVEGSAREQSDAIVKALIKAVKGRRAEQALNIAGRQRMLTQKMAKEAALVGLKYRRRANSRLLAETITVFEDSLNGLIEGSSSLRIPPSPPEVAAKLEEGRALWQDLSPAFTDIADTGRATVFDLQVIAEERDTLLKVMQDAVTIMETS